MLLLELEDPNVAEELGGEIKLSDRTTLPELGGVLEAHRKVLREHEGTLGELHQKIDRMLPETEKLLRQVRSEDRAEWVPGNDASLLDARYLLPDGTVRFGRGTRQVPTFDGSMEEESTEGLLTDPHPCTREQAELQRAFGAFRIAFARARALRAEPVRDTLTRKAFGLLRHHLGRLTGQVGKFCRSMISDPALWKRVISNTAGSGGEMIPTPTIAEVRRPLILARQIMGLIPQETAPAPSFKPVIVTGRALARKRGSTSDDPQRIQTQGFTTADTTVSVVDQAINVLLDPQWITDAGRLFDAMGVVMDYIDQAWSDTLEISALHGDTAATHQDTLTTWTLDSYLTAGQLSGTDSPAAWWIGVRAGAFDDSNTASAGGTFGIDDHFGALALMGIWGNGAVVTTGLACLYTQLLGNSIFTTWDKMGPAATQLTGQLGKIGDTPVVISQFMPKEFNTSSGIYDGSNKGNSMAYFNPRAYRYYILDGGDSWDAVYPERAARFIGETRRGVLAKTVVSGEKPAAVLYNL